MPSKSLDIVLRGHDHASREISRVARSVDQLGTIAKRMQGLLLGVIGVHAIAAGVRNVITTFADFEKQMSRVGAISGATGEQFERLRDMAIELGRTTVFTASQAAEAMSFLAVAGFKVDDILQAMGPTLDLAAAGQLEIAQAADIVAKIMAGMGIQANQVSGAVDVLAKAFTTANTDLLQLGDAMKFVGPIAKSAGKDLTEVTAAIQVLSNAGIQAEMAGTTLRGILLTLANAEAQKKMKDLGVEVLDATGRIRPLADLLDEINDSLAGLGSGQKLGRIGEIFEKRTAAGFVELLAQGGDKLRQFQTQLQNAGGTAQRIAAIQMDNLAGSFDEFTSAIEGAEIALADMQDGPLRSLVDFATQIVSDIPNMLKVIGLHVKITVLNDMVLTITEFWDHFRNTFTNIGLFAAATANSIFTSFQSTFENLARLSSKFISEVQRVDSLEQLALSFGNLAAAPEVKNFAQNLALDVSEALTTQFKTLKLDVEGSGTQATKQTISDLQKQLQEAMSLRGQLGDSSAGRSPAVEGGDGQGLADRIAGAIASRLPSLETSRGVTGVLQRDPAVDLQRQMLQAQKQNNTLTQQTRDAIKLVADVLRQGKPILVGGLFN